MLLIDSSGIVNMCLPHFLRVFLIFVTCQTCLLAMPNAPNQNQHSTEDTNDSNNQLPDIFATLKHSVISNIDEDLFRNHWMQVQQLSKGLGTMQESNTNAATNDISGRLPEKYSRGNFAGASFDCKYERHLCPYGTVCDHIGHICRTLHYSHDD